jgi:hypothetical protein
MKTKICVTILLLAIALWGQKKDHGTIAEAGSIQDYSGAGATMPVKSGTTPPATCVPLKEFFNDTDAPAGQKLLRCKSNGTEWEAVDGAGGSGGVSNHALLTNLDYGASGHTGFESEDHASEHKHGGSDEVATGVAGTAFGIPKADGAGRLDRDWLPGMMGDSGSGGLKGAVPAPAMGDAAKCLKGDGTWGDCGSGASPLVSRGELHTHDGTQNVGLPGGSNEQFLVANDQEPTGLKWSTIRTLVEKEAVPVLTDVATQTLNGISISATQPAGKSAGGTAPPHTVGFLTFADGAAPQTITWETAVPQGWDGTAVELIFRWTRDSGTGNAVHFEISTACAQDGGSVVNPTYNTPAQYVTPGLPTVNTQKTTGFSNLTMTGCAERRTMFIRISRDPTKAADDFTGTANIYSLILRFYVKPQFQ